MNIILEGIDKSGKSSLVNKIYDSLSDTKKYNMKLVHYSCDKPNMDLSYGINRPMKKDIPVFYYMLSYLLHGHDNTFHAGYSLSLPNSFIKNKTFKSKFPDQISKNGIESITIFDRFLYSDVIYRPLLSKDDLSNGLCPRELELSYMELLMKSLGTIVIYAVPPSIDDSIQKLDDEGEGMFNRTSDKYEDYVEKYNELMNNRVSKNFPMFTYSYDTVFFCDIKKWIDCEISKIQANSLYKMLHYLPESLGTYIGTLDFKNIDKLFEIDGKTNEPISYLEYVSLMIDYPEYIGNTNIGITRKNSPLIKIL